VIRSLVMVVLAACAGGKDAPPSEASAPSPAPRVADGTAVLPLGKAPRPTHVVWLDAAGALSIAPTDKVWTGGLPAAKQPVVDLNALAQLVSPDEPAVRDPWSFSSSRALETDAERGFERAPAALGLRDLDEPYVLLLAPPQTAAKRVVELTRRVGGRFGVALPRAQLGTLRVVFRPDAIGSVTDETRGGWVEVHLGKTGIDVLSLPANGIAHVAWGKAMPDELRAIVGGFGKEGPKLDVFAADDVTHQQLVDTLVALDAAGVTKLFLGPSPGPPHTRHASITALVAAQRGDMTDTAVIVLGQPNAQGDLEKTLIRSTIRKQSKALLACYDTQLAKQPDLRGTVSTQFFITPMGTVAASSASGVDQAVADCIAGVIKAVEFPKPKGGGGVQVNYPFTFRPRET